jgi:hypothetical protein
MLRWENKKKMELPFPSTLFLHDKRRATVIECLCVLCSELRALHALSTEPDKIRHEGSIVISLMMIPRKMRLREIKGARLEAQILGP